MIESEFEYREKRSYLHDLIAKGFGDIDPNAPESIYIDKLVVELEEYECQSATLHQEKDAENP